MRVTFYPVFINAFVLLAKYCSEVTGIYESQPLYFETYASKDKELKIKCVFNPSTNSFIGQLQKKKERWWPDTDYNPVEINNQRSYDTSNPWLRRRRRDYQVSDYFNTDDKRAFGGIFSGFGSAIGDMFNGAGSVAHDLVSGFTGQAAKLNDACNSAMTRNQ